MQCSNSLAINVWVLLHAGYCLVASERRDSERDRRERDEERRGKDRRSKHRQQQEASATLAASPRSMSTQLSISFTFCFELVCFKALCHIGSNTVALYKPVMMKNYLDKC